MARAGPGKGGGAGKGAAAVARGRALPAAIAGKAGRRATKGKVASPPAKAKRRKGRSAAMAMLLPDVRAATPERAEAPERPRRGASQGTTKAKREEEEESGGEKQKKKTRSRDRNRNNNSKKTKAGAKQRGRREKKRKQGALSSELVAVTTEYVHRMCLSPNDKTSGEYFTRPEIEARATLREDFRLRMQDVRNSIKRATKFRRKQLKRKLSQIEADQEMILSMNQSAGGSVLKKVYGIGAGGMRRANSVLLPDLQFVSPREGANTDISSVLLAGGAAHRPKSRTRKLSNESRFFNKLDPTQQRGAEKWSPRTQERKRTMRRRPRARSPAARGLEITDDEFAAMYGTESEPRGVKARGGGAEAEDDEQQRPYFVEHMALTAEEKQSRLVFLKDYERQRKRERKKKEAQFAREAAVAAGLDPDALEQEEEERAVLEAEMAQEEARLAHVGKRPWDYSGVPVLPNTTARFDDFSSSDEGDSEEGSDSEGADDSGSDGDRNRNDPDLLRSIFPRPNDITRRCWSKHGYRFHGLPKEQQQRSYKREHQMYLLEEANDALQSIQAKINALEDFRIECGIPEVQRAAEAEQRVIDAMLGLKMSVSSLTDETLADSTEKFCAGLEAARPQPGPVGTGKITDEYADDILTMLSEFAMSVTEGLANDPEDIDWEVMHEELTEHRAKMDGKGIKSALGRRTISLANLTRTFALERGVLEKLIAAYQDKAATLGVEIAHETWMDRTRLADAKKKYHATPYLSGHREKKPPNHTCWVCKAKITFPKTEEGGLFTFCGGCSAFNQNPGASALIKSEDARRDPRARRKQSELIEGVNTVIRDIGAATARGRVIGRGTWGKFDALQRAAAVPTRGGFIGGPGYYDTRKNERKINHVQRVRGARIANKEVLERELLKQKRERNARKQAEEDAQRKREAAKTARL